MVLLGLFVLLPILVVIGNSLTAPDTIPGWTGAVERYASLKQYEQVLFHNLEYWAYFWNTVVLTVPTVLLALLVSSLAAYGLMRLSWRRAILMAYAGLSLLPMQVLLIPNLLALSALQLTGTRMAVILIAGFSPWYVFFLYQVCSQIPQDTFRAARVEGAGELRVYVSVALPQMRSGILMLLVVSSADLWSMIEQPLVFLQDPAKYPMSVMFRELAAGLGDCGAVIFSVPVVILFLCCMTKMESQYV